jgi:multicomponent Na+:H+ antiporter subunit B
MRRIVLFVLLAFAGLLFYGMSYVPARGSDTAPPNTARSSIGSVNAATYYVEHAYEDADTPNMVTVTLADYRGYDTLGETTVIFTAGVACALILRRVRR